MTWSKKLSSLLLMLFFYGAGLPGQVPLWLDSLVMHTDSLATVAIPRDSVYLWNLSNTVEQLAYFNDERLPGYLDRLEDLSTTLAGPLAQGLYLRGKARQLDRSGQFDQALDFYMRAIDSLEKAEVEPGEIAMTYVYGAFLLSNSGSPEKCLALLDQAQPYAERSRDPLPLYYIYDYLGDYHYYSFFRVQNYDKALYYYNQARDLIERFDMRSRRVDNYAGLANVSYRLKNDELADQYWHMADSMAREDQDYNYLYGLYVDKSEIYLDQGREEEAIQLVKSALDFAQKTAWPELVARAQNQLYQTYRQIGNFEQALYAFEEYRVAQDSMNKQSLLQRYSELEALYESEQREQLITELQNRNLRQTRNFLVGIVVLALLLMFLGAWTIIRLNRNNKLLKAKNREILEAQIKGQTIERKRVASELHDNLNTKVAALRWQLQALDQVQEPGARKILDNALKLINDVYGDIRLISHNLMPEEIESIGLAPALDNLISQLNSNNRVDFKLIADVDALDFPVRLTYPLYNISFELINNILKHAQADQAWISLSSLDDKVTITVRDNGQGFDQSHKPGGVGLKNIRSRVEHLGGTLQIESEPNQGTKTTVQIPVH